MPSINIEVVKEQAFMGVPSKLPNICDIEDVALENMHSICIIIDTSLSLMIKQMFSFKGAYKKDTRRSGYLFRKDTRL